VTVSAKAPARIIVQRRWLPRAPGSAAQVAAGMVLALLAVAAVLAPLIAPHDPNAVDLGAALEPASGSHLLGQDNVGRDIFSRLLYGGRSSLLGPGIVVLISSAIGIPLGLLAGYRRGFVDAALSRIWDVVFAFPPLLLAIVTVAAFGPGFWTATLAISIVYTPLLARVVRAAVLAERGKAYVDAFRVTGFGSTRIAVGHVLPNLGPTIVAQSTLNFGYALLDLAALAFLGLGVQPPSADWGAMLAEGRKSILIAPTEVLAASAVIAVAVVAFNLLGDALSERIA
jgi:peptide/nickel transport system permease protein